MVRWLRWIAVVAMFVVGAGAVYVSTVEVSDARAATAGLLTQQAQRTDVARTSAATGTVASAATYALGFGQDPRLADTTATATSASDWTVDEVLAAVGDQVMAGQLLATAVTADIEGDLAVATADLELARMKLDEAVRGLKDARTDAQRQRTDARTAVTAGKYAVKNAKVQRNEAASGNPKRQAKIALLQAQDQLRAAKRTRDDLGTALDGDFPEQRIAVGEAEQALADLEAQVADLSEQLEQASIIAPVDGVVADVAVRPGFVAPDGDAITITSSEMEVVADVVEADVSALQAGQTATVAIDALGLEVPGIVTSIAPTTETTSGSVVTYPVTVTLSDPDPMIKPGMSSDVEITIAQAADVVAVPAVALSGQDGAYTVQVATTGGAQARPVEVGIVTETLAEIQSGVAEGEPVVIGTSSDRIVSEDADAGGFGGAGALGGRGGFGGLQGGGGRRGGGN